jgi:hypothetical protein
MIKRRILSFISGMKNRASQGVILASTAAISILAFSGILEAAPDSSQRLRGLGDRVFYVWVDIEIPGVGVFPFSDNCYFFDGNGDWYESAFPTAGTWTQDSVGAKTTYSVDGSTGDGSGFEQIGLITPAGGRGLLQLESVSTVDGTPFIFHSVGSEIDESDADSLCPFPPEIV